jgi:saccharopine dehydrogenase (NAD+, L-lysine-forming)
MIKPLKVGILRETKNPPDRRVPLTPPQIIALQEMYPDVEFFVQPSDLRCYSDEEYQYLKIPLKEDLSDCDILMGVKEVDFRTLIPGKTYLFFAHVTKEQPYNREMFREIARRRIHLIDYEYLTKENGQRVVAFGRYAGIVGAYNGLRARGIRTNRFNLKPAYLCRDLSDMWAGLHLIEMTPGLKILITGEGRVAGGAAETLGAGNVVEVSPEEYLNREFDVPVFARIGPQHYTRHREGRKYSFPHYCSNPEEYESSFLPYTRVTDILITGHYWDPRSPVFFTREDMTGPGFRISVIADISCDIMGPIPSTVRASTISDPFYGYNPHLDIEEPAFSRKENITVMSVDNLPGELPRDSSYDFGIQLTELVLDDLFKGAVSPLIERATIISGGKLSADFEYLRDYLER